MKQALTTREFREHIHKALQLWHSDAAQGSPLPHLLLVQQEQALAGTNIRRATNEVLLRGIKRLEAEYPQDADLLRARFLNDEMVNHIANRLGVSESALYKLQRQAIGRLADGLCAQEQAARDARGTALADRLPPPTYDHLSGVDAHLQHLGDLLQTPQAPWLIAVEGIGGIGKTALAHQLVQRLVTEGAFADFGWVTVQQRAFHLDLEGASTAAPALTPDGLIQELLIQLASPGGPAAPISPERALAALEARLRQAPHLIVIDNLETMADVTSLLPALLRLANPSKFLLASRVMHPGQPGVYHFPVPELAEPDALALMRQEARLRNMPYVAAATDADLRPVFETVGGNPLALRLITGQLHFLSLDEVVANLREARGKKIDELYRHIYWHAWQRLPADGREVLMLMPHFAGSGADLAAITRISDLPADRTLEVLELLVRLSLVNVGGDLRGRRYSIHRLTETFLLNEVLKWQAVETP